MYTPFKVEYDEIVSEISIVQLHDCISHLESTTIVFHITELETLQDHTFT